MPIIFKISGSKNFSINEDAYNVHGRESSL
jgi:hypothetical protein